MKTIVSFDTETTGLIKPEACHIDEQPYIIELAASKYTIDGKVIERFYAKIKPPIPIPKVITKMFGTKDEDFIGKPTFVGIYQDLADFMVGSHILSAHNLAFDREMLANELIRIDRIFKFPWPPVHICTVRETTKIHGYRLNMTKLHEYCFGEGFENAHSAVADVEAQARCFLHLVKTGRIRL